MRAASKSKSEAEATGERGLGLKSEWGGCGGASGKSPGFCGHKAAMCTATAKQDPSIQRPLDQHPGITPGMP